MRPSQTRRSAPSFAAFLLAAVCAGSAVGQPTITNLGVLGGGNFSFASAISADGLVVCGSSTSSGGQRAFRWTAAEGMASIGALTGFTNSSTATAISTDGSVIAGISYGANSTARGFRWTDSTGAQTIGVLGTGSASYARAISGNGAVIAGGSYTASLSNFTGASWTSATGLQTLGGTAAYGVAISADGAVIAGTDIVGGYSRAFRWTSVGGIQYLDLPVGADASDGSAISADGSVVAGYVADQVGGTFTHAFLWTGLGGGGTGMRDLGALNGSDTSATYAISGDGSVVGGTALISGSERAWLWTASVGLVDLNAYLSSLGVDLAGWTLSAVRGISADGSAIVGEGTFNGSLRAFLVRGTVPWPPCSPTISTQPQDATGCLTSTAVFTVAAGPAAYQWRKGHVPINVIANPSAATATLTLSNIHATDAGVYDCVLSSDCGSQTSHGALLSICVADFNCSGAAGLQDLFDFLGAYFASDPRADVNGVGGVSLQDVFDYLAAYFQGCA